MSPPTGILISYPILIEFPHAPPPSTTTSSSPSTSGLYLGVIESYQPSSIYTPSSPPTKKRRTNTITTTIDHGLYRARFLDGDINDYTPAEAWEGVVTFVEQYTTFIDGPHQESSEIKKRDIFGKGPQDVITQQTMMEYWERRLKSWWTKDSKDDNNIGLLTREDVKLLDREWGECWEEYRDFMTKEGVLEPTGSLVDGLAGRAKSLLLLEEEDEVPRPIISLPTGVLTSYPILMNFPHPSSALINFPFAPASGLYLGSIESYNPPSIYTMNEPRPPLTKNIKTKPNTTTVDHGFYRARFLDGDIHDLTPAEAWEGVISFVEQYIAIIDDPYEIVPTITKRDVFGKGPLHFIEDKTMIDYWERRRQSCRTKDSKDDSSIGSFTREDLTLIDREWRECWEEYRDFMIGEGITEPKGSLVDGLLGRVRIFLNLF